MELTIEQALQQGIAAHKAGKLRDAEKLYRAILQSQPNHPDANHNLGVVAVSVNKADAAISLFKTALEANSKIEQFWLSYIDALIKLGQLDNARQILQQGKASGLTGEKIDQLEVQLGSTASSSGPVPVSNSNNPSQQQIDGVIALYTQGKLQEALVQSTALESQFPNNPIILNILGVIYTRLGRHEEAIDSYNKAIELKPDDAEVYNNRGIALNELGKHEEAIDSYNKAIELKPNVAVTHYNLGNVLNELGKHEEAIASFNKAIELKPDYVDAHNNLGITLKELGRLNEAEASYKQAIAFKPDYVDAHSNLGNALNEMGKYEEAIASYNKAIEFKPEAAEAYHNLGLILRAIKVNTFSESLAKNYLDVLNFGSIVRPFWLVGSIITLLKHHDTIKEVICCKEQNTLEESASELCIQLSEIPLFIKIMEVCPLPDLDIEDVLAGLRKILLLNRHKLSVNNDLLSFQSALALQCFTNEFIYGETEEETITIQSLETSLQQAFSNNEEPSFYDITCLASYRSLFNYPWATDITPPPILERLFKRQVIEVNKELALKESIARLNPINDDVSVAVQNQYEENPYPRWIDTQLEIRPLSINQVIAQQELQVIRDINLLSEAPQILIAGCGTGQHALDTASSFEKSHITAIDLSLSSLAYAKRKTEELGFTNIDYLQADILDLGMLGKQFDIIESVGVLHHMADPLSGWKILTDCLKPGGIMKIGLYSELARQHVVTARDLIAEKNISADKKGMLTFREEITKLDDPRLNLLKTSIDFYSTSTVRDLLFHVQEHRFTIPQISAALDELGLAFMGFTFPEKSIMKAFKMAYPKKDALYDLDTWHDYETSNPRLFSGMYAFWAQKL